DRNRRVFQFLAQRVTEGVEQSFGPAVDRMKGTGHQSSDRTRDENTARFVRQHLSTKLMDQTQRPADVRVDYPEDIVEILVEECPTQSAPRVSEKGIHPSFTDVIDDLHHPSHRR